MLYPFGSSLHHLLRSDGRRSEELWLELHGLDAKSWHHFGSSLSDTWVVKYSLSRDSSYYEWNGSLFDRSWHLINKIDDSLVEMS